MALSCKNVFKQVVNLVKMENANLKDILARANDIVDVTIGELTNGIGANFRDKGALGNLIQVHGFFIKKNNDAEPDFKKEKIELKIVPLEQYKARDGFRIKERTKVCSINYMNLISQKWTSSHAKRKIDRILFIFYLYNKAEPLKSVIKRQFLYELKTKGADEVILKSDWELIKDQVNKGNAYLLSETLTKVLAATRSGRGGPDDWVEQPNNYNIKTARKRAFTLKPNFTRVLWNELNKTEYDSLQEKHKINNVEQIERILLDRLSRFKGKSLHQLSKEYSIDINKSKSAAASLLRASLGFKGKFKPIKELEQLGLVVKMVPVGTMDATPWEGTSFPYQPLGEIREEGSFDKSELLINLQGIVFIPVYRDQRKRDSLRNDIVGQPFIWRPSAAELSIIKREWEKYRRVIRTGVKTERVQVNTEKGYKIVNNLPNESETQIIHMRPHARDSYDLDPSLPAKLELCKHSFWLNKQFVKKLIEDNQ